MLLRKEVGSWELLPNYRHCAGGGAHRESVSQLFLHVSVWAMWVFSHVPNVKSHAASPGFLSEEISPCVAVHGRR